MQSALSVIALYAPPVSKMPVLFAPPGNEWAMLQFLCDPRPWMREQKELIRRTLEDRYLANQELFDVGMIMEADFRAMTTLDVNSFARSLSRVLAIEEYVIVWCRRIVPLNAEVNEEYWEAASGRHIMISMTYILALENSLRNGTPFIDPYPELEVPLNRLRGEFPPLAQE